MTDGYVVERAVELAICASRSLREVVTSNPSSDKLSDIEVIKHAAELEAAALRWKLVRALESGNELDLPAYEVEEDALA